MQREALRAFVVEAHRNGYATSNAEEEPGQIKTIEYERDDWEYVDRYAGSRDFLGFEAVTHEGRFVWGMNYYGYMTDETVDEGPIYGFLRDVMAQVSADHPFRGPPLARDALEYSIETTGDIERFHGTETIRLDGESVYSGFFRGGLVE